MKKKKDKRLHGMLNFSAFIYYYLKTRSSGDRVISIYKAIDVNNKRDHIIQLTH